MSERVVIAIDPHKASWTAAAVNSSLQPVATIRVPVTRAGYRSLRKFAAQWPAATWAIEGASGLGAPLNRWLAADQIVAVDVPAKLAARVRMLSTGHGRKSDNADATSVGIAALTAVNLRAAAVDEAITVLRALVEHRDDIVKTRTQTVNRVHVLLARLLPGGAPRDLDADKAAQLLRPIRPREIGQRTLRQLAIELVAEIRHLDRRIGAANTKIADAVQASGSTLTDFSARGWRWARPRPCTTRCTNSRHSGGAQLHRATKVEPTATAMGSLRRH